MCPHQATMTNFFENLSELTDSEGDTAIETRKKKKNKQKKKGKMLIPLLLN